MKSCNCKSGASNTGVPFCVDVYNRTKQIIFQSIFDSTGVRNSIKDSDFVNGVLPKTYIDSMILLGYRGWQSVSEKSLNIGVIW